MQKSKNLTQESSKHNHYHVEIIAKTFQGLENVLAQEIENIGGQNLTIVNRAVIYEGDASVLYKSNIMLRTALRILVIKKEFTIRKVSDLYDELSKIPWEGMMTLKQTFAIDCICHSPLFNHTLYPSQLSKDAVVDRFRRKFGKRPNVNPVNPDFRLNIHIREHTVTFSLDSSGSSLHKRGYRIAAVDAPLNEAMAAGIVLLSDWDGTSDFLDPMCGSGTIACEAAMIAAQMPPQRQDRKYTFEKWKSFDAALYNEIKDECFSRKQDPSCKIYGRDKSMRAYKISLQNATEAGVIDYVDFAKADFFKSPMDGNFTIVTNPPYDERLKIKDINAYYKAMGDTLKTHYPGSTAYIFSGNIDALKCVGLKPARKVPLLNGKIESRLYRFNLYAGYGDE